MFSKRITIDKVRLESNSFNLFLDSVYSYNFTFMLVSLIVFPFP